MKVRVKHFQNSHTEFSQIHHMDWNKSGRAFAELSKEYIVGSQNCKNPLDVQNITLNFPLAGILQTHRG